MKLFMLFSIGLAFVFPVTAFAELPATKTTYLLAIPEENAKKTIENGIEKAVEDMMFITRPIARSRLKSTNRPIKTLGFQQVGDKITIVYDNSISITQTNGKPGKWKRDDGEMFTVTHTLNGNVLTQKFVAEDGEKLLTFVFSKDGSRMNLTVRLTSEKLAAPMVYRIPFKKG